MLGLRDYFAKCGFHSTVLGLSGGIDSAVTACLAVAALGAENVLGVAMPSPYSSQGSVDDALALARNLGIPCHTMPISKPFEVFKAQFAGIFAGRDEDATEENMQARLRGMTLMAISNKFGSLLLTTGNKSELAVGYCTLYGDMAGGLAVISDVPKTSVYRLARYINRAREIIPVNTIDKPPSAELKHDQKDQDTLPPYDVLDEVLQLYVGGKPQRGGNHHARLRRENCALDSAPGRSQRIQACPSRPRLESHQQGLWLRSPDAHRATIRGMMMGGNDEAVPPAQTVAVVGASADRRKFGNKAVRAFQAAGWRVFPVNPRGEEVEGIAVFRSVEEIVGPLDVVSLYVAPAVGLKLLPGIAAKMPGELWVNPGAGDAALIAEAKARGLHAVELCSIIQIGFSPSDFPVETVSDAS